MNGLIENIKLFSLLVRIRLRTSSIPASQEASSNWNFSALDSVKSSEKSENTLLFQVRDTVTSLFTVYMTDDFFLFGCKIVKILKMQEFAFQIFGGSGFTLFSITFLYRFSNFYISGFFFHARLTKYKRISGDKIWERPHYSLRTEED